MPELQTVWGWLTAIDLFCGGLVAGTFVTIAIIQLVKGNRFQSTVKFGSWVSAAAVIIGVLCLLADVGKPLRAMALWQSFTNFDSWMAIGAWLMFSAIVIYLIHALLKTDRVMAWVNGWWSGLARNRDVVAKVLAVIGIPLSLAVATYTGMLLSTPRFIPFWHNNLLPVLFVVSALTSGVFILGAYAILREKDEGTMRLITGLKIASVVLVAVVAYVLWYYMDIMRDATATSVSVDILTTGELSVSFWTTVVALGLGVPLLAVLVSFIPGLNRAGMRPSAVVPVAGVVLGLVGAFMLRYLFLSVGIHAPLTSPGMLQAIEGATFFLPLPFIP